MATTTLHDIATALTELDRGSTWHANEDRQTIINTARALESLHFSARYNRQSHWQITGSLSSGALNLYDFVPYAEKDTNRAINVARGKTAEQIARDIIRRLLPDYRRIVTLALARKSEVEDHESRECIMLEQAIKVIGGTVREKRPVYLSADQHVNEFSGDGPINTGYLENPMPWEREGRKLHVSGSVSSGRGITIELQYLTVAELTRVMQALRGE